MSRDALLSREDFGLKIYNRFPPKYREDDAFVKYALKRYLQACGDGGFAYAIDEWNGILNIQDPQVVDSKVLPYLYQQYGFNLFHGIPEEYLRYLLPKLSEAWAKKGSLDVIEFIVSALSGIKTETTLWYDNNGDANLDVKLEMDYNMGTYFPDATQFNRILDAFVPFYLKKTLIYSWVFYESQKVWLTENYFFDKVNEFYPVSAFIPFAKGTRFVPALNNMEYTLNDTLITNVMRTFNDDPDSFFDLVSMKAVEESDSVDLLEYLKDKVKLKVIHDTQEVRGADSRFDAVKIEDAFMYYPVLNTDLMLNVDLMTNWGTEDRIDLDTDEYWTPDKCALVTITESQNVDNNKSNDLYQGLFLNIKESVLNSGRTCVPDIFDRITYNNIGVSVIAFPSLYSYAGAL